MIQKLYRYLLILGPAKLVEYFFLEARIVTRRILQNSYSQWGEDIVIDNLLGKKVRGFYVDVGAYDPTRFSNTKRFYLRRWRGINIEPDAERVKKFHKERFRDVNLNIGIADRRGMLNFYRFDPPTLSTFSQTSAKDYQEQGYKLLETKKVPVHKLADILKKYAKGQKIDFFSIDTEGLDMEVLKSNNWKRFKPKVICIEGGSGAEKFLSSLGYKKVSQTPTNSIFVLKVPQ